MNSVLSGGSVHSWVVLPMPLPPSSTPLMPRVSFSRSPPEMMGRPVIEPPGRSRDWSSEGPP
jgi:hypothetical protein